MEQSEAKEIIGSLANGVNPITGEIFPEDSPYNNPKIIRALFTVLHFLENPRKREKKSIEEKQLENIANGRPRNAGLPWDDQQRQSLSNKFKEGSSVIQLANDFERTRGAIISELERQRIISGEEAMHL